MITAALVVSSFFFSFWLDQARWFMRESNAIISFVKYLKIILFYQDNVTVVEESITSALRPATTAAAAAINQGRRDERTVGGLKCRSCRSLVASHKNITALSVEMAINWFAISPPTSLTFISWSRRCLLLDMCVCLSVCYCDRWRYCSCQSSRTSFTAAL